MIPIANLPLRTDKQADRLARRKVRLDNRKQRIEEQRDARAKNIRAKADKRIEKIKAKAEQRIEKIDQVRKPLGARLFDFVVNVRKHKRDLMLSTGTKLSVYTNYKVVAKDGNDDAAVAELEELGRDDMVRIKKEPNRQLLAQRTNRHIVNGMDTLSLEPVRTLKIELAE